MQTGFDDGEIDFTRIVGDLKAADYSGIIALEVVHVDWLSLDGQDVLSETVRLRDQLLDLI